MTNTGKVKQATENMAGRKASVGQAAGTSRPGGGILDNVVGLETTRGRVAGYNIGANGLIVHLDVGAIRKIAFSVGHDEPHFRSAVSMTMVALNNRVNPSTDNGGDGFDQQYLWVSMHSVTAGETIRPAIKVAMSHNNDNDPFDSEAWALTQ